MRRYKRRLLTGCLVLLAVAALLVPAVALTTAGDHGGATTELTSFRPSGACFGPGPDQLRKNGFALGESA